MEIRKRQLKMLLKNEAFRDLRLFQNQPGFETGRLPMSRGAIKLHTKQKMILCISK
jgi:hypothetical protein